MEFELTYFNIAVEHFSHYNTETPPDWRLVTE